MGKELLWYFLLTSAVIASVMIIGNPFFEDKRLAHLTLIPVITGWLIGLLLVVLS